MPEARPCEGELIVIPAPDLVPRGQLRTPPSPCDTRHGEQLYRCLDALKLEGPRSSKWSPAPSAKARVTADAKTSEGWAAAMIRAVTCTAMPRTSSGSTSTSPVWTPVRILIPSSRVASPGNVARDVEKNRRLVADHPGVMARRDVHDVVLGELVDLAVPHLERDATGEQHVDVVELAEFGSDRTLKVG